MTVPRRKPTCGLEPPRSLNAARQGDSRLRVAVSEPCSAMLKSRAAPGHRADDKEIRVSRSGRGRSDEFATIRRATWGVSCLRRRSMT